MSAAQHNRHKIDLAYVAGLFDGDGTCGNHGITRKRLVAKVTNTHIGCLYRTRDIMQYGGVTTLYHVEDKLDVTKSCYEYKTYDYTARKFLRAVQPFSIIKLDKINKLIGKRRKYQLLHNSSQIILAYIAGLFDSEGDCGIYTYQATRNKYWYRRLIVRITNTNKKCLKYIRQNMRFGWVVRQNKKLKGNRKPCFSFCISGTKAAKFLETIKPYLAVKLALANKILRSRWYGRD